MIVTDDSVGISEFHNGIERYPTRARKAKEMQILRRIRLPPLLHIQRLHSQM